jgi:hypothetical protein
MKTIFFRLFFFLAIFMPLFGQATLFVGIGKADLTPPLGTPSAGYRDRNGEGMNGTHDPLLAIALFMDNGQKKIVFCSVDHLGFTYEMVQNIRERIHAVPHLKECEIYIGSSHTHSGGGAYLNIPYIGEVLAGPFNSDIAELYVSKTVEAILQASSKLVSARIGFGYGKAEGLSVYRASWPKEGNTVNDVAVIKITRTDGAPFAVLFNFAVHPTVLTAQNRQFSADFVGYARDHLKQLIGSNVQAIYFNGAQGDINPALTNEENRFAACDFLGRSLAKAVFDIWKQTEVQDEVSIHTQRLAYSFKPEATPFGLKIPLESYASELNGIVFNRQHAFLTIPGELSSFYDRHLKMVGGQLGYAHVSLLGLTNDAHGYIILPEAWQQKTFESGLSFGGESYGETVKQKAISLLQSFLNN